MVGEYFRKHFSNDDWERPFIKGSGFRKLQK